LKTLRRVIERGAAFKLALLGARRALWKAQQRETGLSKRNYHITVKTWNQPELKQTSHAPWLEGGKCFAGRRGIERHGRGYPAIACVARQRGEHRSASCSLQVGM